MNIATVGALAGIASSFVAVWTFYLYLRGQARQRVEQDDRERDELADKKFTDGVRSRDDEVRQLVYERDDARRERDNALTDVRELNAENRRIRNNGRA